MAVAHLAIVGSFSWYLGWRAGMRRVRRYDRITITTLGETRTAWMEPLP